MSQQDMNKQPDNSDSQCYFVQLQIDSFLDGELSSEQQQIFATHVHDCAACAAELQFAQTVHDSLMDLPLLNSTDAALEPMDRLGGEAVAPVPARTEWVSSLGSWLATWPAGLRYGMPVAAAVVVTLLLVPVFTGDSQTPVAVAGGDTGPESATEYSQEDVMAALNDLNTAIGYLNQVSQRTETMIGGRFVLVPLQESLNASFERVRDQDDDPLDDDPI